MDAADRKRIDGEAVPAIGLGTWQLSGRSCRRAVSAALELGYRVIDTAQGYENEADVGAAIEESDVARDEVFLITKVWPDHLVADERVVDESLDRLRTERVDLLLLHWPSPTLPAAQTAEALGAVLESGKARYVGVSNFPPSLLLEARARAPIACNQIEVHPYLAQERLVALCREQGVLVTAYCPLAHGRVKGDPVLERIGRRHGKSAAQVALRWLLERRGVCAVPKASSGAHLRENLAVFDFGLSGDELEEIAALDRGERIIDPEFAPDWEDAATGRERGT